MNPLSVILIVVFSIIVVLIVIFFSVPSLRNEFSETRKKTREEIATEEVKSMVREEASSSEDKEIETGKLLDRLAEMEERTGVSFTPEETKFIVLDFLILKDEL